MSMDKVLAGFVPWFVFGLVASREGPGAVPTAAWLACAVAVAMIVAGLTRGRSPKLLEVAAAVVFALFGVVGTVVPAADDLLAGYGRSLAALLLAAVIFLLLPFLPFTEQYARETVPEQYWHSPVFRATNRRISAAWGGVVAVMAVGHAVAGLVAELPGAVPSRPVDLLFNWVVPGLLVWWAVRYTQRVSAEAGRDAPAPQRS